MELPDHVTRHILDVAVAIMQADCASLQRYDTKRNALKLITQCGLDPACAAAWEWVFPDSLTCCAESLRTHRRVMVPDIETSDFLASGREPYRTCGIRAVQTTPLHANGHLLGMISTHWRNPSEPDASRFDLFDLWAQQTADMFSVNSAMSQLLQQATTELARCHRLMRQLEQELNRAVSDGRLQLPPPPGSLH